MHLDQDLGRVSNSAYEPTTVRCLLLSHGVPLHREFV